MLGFISVPPSRTVRAMRGENINAGDDARFAATGVKGPGGFPRGGPEDGKIASAGDARYSALDEQSSTRWPKLDIPKRFREAEFVWEMTEPVPTRSFEFFITKDNWDPDKPLTRDSFYLLPILHHDAQGKRRTSLQRMVPLEGYHTGYHVILGVWNSADNESAVYQVVDVNFTT
ncbi:lytic polysaccharide monooxygenase [Streptomyces sp. NPDC052496]|uniref:lytic polysaccharide monooxygenase n=1 Tax=Streptomyces sp. NPDC052496 TaxID=3154951 RepID=UPI003434064C